MAEQKIVRLNLMIGGRSYPVKIEKSEVPALKKLESTIHSKLNEYMIKYPNYERIDLLTMTFLAVIFDLYQKQEDTSGKVLERRINDLFQLLEDSL